MEDPQVKKCTICNKTKPLDEFSTDRRKKYGKSSRCKECKNKNTRNLYNSSETYRQYQKTKSIQWRKNNPEKVKGRKRQDPAYYAQKAKQWREKNPERTSAHYRATDARQRAKESGAGGKYTADEWLALLAQYGGKCLCCGATEDIQADHIVPISEGGDSFITNIQPLCKACNMAKGKKTTDYRP